MSSNPKPSKKLVEALGVAWELSGSPKLSDAAATALLAKLSAYPEADVLKALDRCANEVTGRLSLAHIIQRIDDGRPTADEAWGQVGTESEYVTFVTTTEAMEARRAADLLLAEGDGVAARRAFIDAYQRIVTENRGAGVPVKPHVSLGFDRPGQVRVLAQAVQAGRLSAEYAADLIGMTPGELSGKAQPTQAPQLAEVVRLVARRVGPPPCGTDPTCDGWTHGGAKPCPVHWGSLP